MKFLLKSSQYFGLALASLMVVFVNAQNTENVKVLSGEHLASTKNVTVYQSEEESLMFSATILAGEIGIPVEKAADVLRFQRDFANSMQEHLLPTNRVASYEVLSAPAIGAVVRLTTGPGHPAEKALARYDNVTIKRDAKFSLADQFFRVEAITNGLKNSGINKYRITPGADQIKVQLPEHHRMSAERLAEITEKAAELMEGPSIWPGIGTMEKPQYSSRSSARAFTGADMQVSYLPQERFTIRREIGGELGGSRMFNYNVNGGLSNCTSAFTTYRGILTAGHCHDDYGFDQVSSTVSHYFGGTTNTIYPVASYQGWNGDHALNRNNSGHYSFFWNSPWSFSRQYGAAYAADQQIICNFGRSKGYTSCNHTNLGWVNLGIWVMQLTNANTGPGDSGGPYFVSGTGYGIHSGSDGPDYPGALLYMSVLPFALHTFNTGILR